jgi:phosphatidylglycerophosphate synthase
MKIPLEYEDKIDNKLCSWSDALCPCFKTCGFTPNMITTLALFCTIAIIYFILNKKCEIAAGFYILAYFFDCMDGIFARKYKMTSKYGDYYEHIVDWIRNVAVLLMIFYSCSCNNKAIPIMALVILFVLGNIKQAYQDKYYKVKTGREETESLNFVEQFISPPNTLEGIDNGLKKLKYIGWGTFTITAAVFLGTCNDADVDINKIFESIKDKIKNIF